MRMNFIKNLAAQLERFMELAGKLPSHMDAHYHVAFMHPAALEATLALAQEHQLPLRNAFPKFRSRRQIFQHFKSSYPIYQRH